MRVVMAEARAAERALVGILFLCTTLAACNESKRGVPNHGMRKAGKAGAGPSEDDMPVGVEVAGSSLTLGFATGRMRESVNLAGFTITQHPITHAEYGACVAAGACREPSKTACSEEALQSLSGFGLDDAKSPAVCVGTANARSYCGWIGGRLPKLSEWLLAVRGSEPRRFAWGDAAPTCAQHPRALRPRDPSQRSPLRPQPPCNLDSRGAPLAIGTSPGQRDADDVAQDVLLTDAELVDADANSLWTACSPAVSGSCLVYGREAGAIDAVSGLGAPAPAATEKPAPSQAAPVPEDTAGRAYSFRCVVEK